MADKPEAKPESRQESKLADPLNLGRLEVEAQMRELGKRAIPFDTKLPAAFAGGVTEFTIVDNRIDGHVANAKAKMTPDQLARAEKAADLPHRVVDAAFNQGAIPEVSGYRRNLDATSVKAQGAKVDREISGHIADAKAKMTPEQLARVEKEADVNRWITAAGRIGDKAEVSARPGETYSSIARDLITEREGRRPSRTEVHVMATAIAEYNGKTGDQANSLKVDEVVKLPPMHKAV